MKSNKDERKFERIVEKLPQQAKRDEEWMLEQQNKMKKMGLYCSTEESKGFSKEFLQERKQRLAERRTKIKEFLISINFRNLPISKLLKIVIFNNIKSERDHIFTLQSLKIFIKRNL